MMLTTSMRPSAACRMYSERLKLRSLARRWISACSSWLTRARIVVVLSLAIWRTMAQGAGHS